MKIRTLLLVQTIFVALYCGTVQADLIDDTWTEVRSDNFEIYSNTDTNEIRALARDLEHFRTIVQLRTNTRSSIRTLPFRIVALKTSRDFKSFNDIRNVAGFYFPSLRGHYAFLDLSQRMQLSSRRTASAGRRILLHEYVHYLTRNNTTIKYPRWYDEGLAEYLSTLTYEDGRAVIGTPILGRIQTMTDNRFVPLHRLIDESGEEREVDVYRFYAQSWLLVHHLSTEAEFAEHLVDYLRRYDSGEDPVSAFEDEFGITLKSLGQKLKRKWRKGRYKTLVLDFPKPLPEPQLRVSKMSDIEKWQQLGEAYSGLGYTDEARSLFSKITQKEASNAKAVAGLADLALREADLNKAASILKTLPEETQSVPLLIARGDQTFARLIQAAPTHSAIPVERRQTARDYYLDALRLDPQSAEGYYSYGLTFLGSSEQTQEGRKAFEQAIRLLPAYTYLQIYAAVAYFQVGDNDAGCRATREVVNWGDSAFLKKAATRLQKICAAPSPTDARAYGYELVRRAYLSRKDEEEEDED